MKVRRTSGGFTLLEFMLALAIIGVLSSIAAVNIVRSQRKLTQTEFDGIAREIFVAAQNHLTMAEGQGFMGISDSGGDEDGLAFGVEDEEKTNVYYYVVNDGLLAQLDERRRNNQADMLNLMLPPSSVDGLSSGSYVIRYQKDPALVLDVFYVAKTGKFAYSFEPDETGSLLSGYVGDDKRKARGRYGDGGNVIIGWYGRGAPEPVTKGAPLYPPTVRLVNAERLYVDVTNPNASVEKAGLKLEITGLTSNKTCRLTLIDKSGAINRKYSNDKADFRVILDDVTSEDSHFWQVCCSKNANLEPESELLPYPGEDIRVCAVSYNNQELTNIATSATSVRTNSLFASLEKLENPDNSLPPSLGPRNVYKATISNFRHLENLDNAISNIPVFQPTDKVVVKVEIDGAERQVEKSLLYYVLGDKEIIITRAEQTGDMDWSAFADANTQIYDYQGVAITEKGCYYPITNGGKIEYAGEIPKSMGNTETRAAKISNVKISVSGTDKRAGLFATLGNDSVVRDLKLVNFSVTSKDGAAGALAGVLQGDSRALRVLAHHDHGEPGDGYKVVGKTAAGGLIGEITGARALKQNAVEQCAAALLVKSSGGDAGGLIGKIGNTEAVTLPVSISDSYAGGHTENGAYTASCNVVGGANAGGLIGSGEGNLTVKNCYSTASADGTAAAGGLIGKITAGRVENCYAVGSVKGATAGAFTGDAGSVTFGNDRYLKIINSVFDENGDETESLPALGAGDASDNIYAFDDVREDYGAYYGRLNALPYDEKLENRYMFKTISELSNEATSPDWMATHYGDWSLGAMEEALVVNTK